MKHGPRPALLMDLKRDDFHINNAVKVAFQDNSAVRFRCAFYHREGRWLAIYTLNCGCHMFPFESVKTVSGSCRVD